MRVFPVLTNGTKIDNVVVQGEDNKYYLSHNFKKEKSQPGTLFVDYRCNLDTSNNVIIYGHKQVDKSMFGTLNRYHNNIEFYKQHPTFEFSDLYGTYYYKIIGYFVCKTNKSLFKYDAEIFDYQNYINFDDNHSYFDFIINTKAHSEVLTPVDIRDTDKFLTLSTCSYEYTGARFVIVARRVRPNETIKVYVDAVRENETQIR